MGEAEVTSVSVMSTRGRAGGAPPVTLAVRHDAVCGGFSGRVGVSPNTDSPVATHELRLLSASASLAMGLALPAVAAVAVDAAAGVECCCCCGGGGSGARGL